MNMKTNTQRVLWAGLLLCCPLAALAVPVTFQVDMEYQTTNATPSFVPPADTVEAKGSWNNFGPGYALVNVPGTTVYTNTLEVAGTAGDTIRYKFHTYGTHDVWEGIQSYIYTNGGNRAFVLGSSAQTLPAAYFADVWGGTLPLSVQVDVLAQTLAGNFTPGTDTVELKGSFDGWSNGHALTNDATGISAPTNIYSTTIDIGPVVSSAAPGALGAYKFHIYGSHDVWESDPNRLMLVTSPTTVLPVVCFNRACSIPVRVGLYMQVDMSSQILAGNFDPAGSYQLWADGDNLGGWGDPPQGTQMFEDTSRLGIFTNYWSGLMSPGATFPFKFKIWNTSNAGTTWENFPGNTNRTVVWSGAEALDSHANHLITLGPVLFSNFQANTNDYLPNDTLVTFSVSMTNAVGVTDNNPTYGGIAWESGPHSVYINGPFVNFNGVPHAWWGTAGSFNKTPVDDAPLAWQLVNNSFPSEIYSLQVLLPKGSPVRVQYKYSIDGYDNEAAPGQDHFREVRTLGLANYAFPMDTFGTNSVEPAFGNLSIGAASAGKVPISWLGLPGVHLQTKANLAAGTWTDLYNTDGTNWTAGYMSTDGLTSLTNYTMGGAPTFFRLIKTGPSN